ncbi:electron transfer flavoprotein subunit alpha/FixB family protein [Schaalia suimastitidis]|uniref:electron transfer flavoprotein subunit alpha/FixB family protein n=1 Tax=Schaalia suimastitidis TaxID=121163 RepID=UPI00041D3B30|nr:electron transfer flavoprotein subunit alpha/FixB family protein [Schaalia suimastitidis]
MTNTWIITTSASIAQLVDTGRTVGGRITVVAVAPEAPQVAGVDDLIHIPTGQTPAEAFGAVVAEVLTQAGGDVILANDRPAERVLAGFAAARLGLPMIVGASAITANSATVSRFGGITEETVSFNGAVFLAEGGAPTQGDAVSARTQQGEGLPATLLSVNASDGAEANLVGARRIVACGRGFKNEEDLDLARRLAEALGAELACSRPLAEGNAWLAKDRYIGVSGMRVAPELYVAIGISGQVQHTSGMAGSKVVVAINSDENAPIFSINDYGIVGDLYDVVPALTAALS